MIIFPNTKINIGLNITDKRPDGYHNLETIFYPISLEDALEVTQTENSQEKYIFNTSGLPVKGNSDDNLVIKAYRLVKEKHKNITPIKINLYKNIPMGAGLGGGSSDAASMIMILNNMFQLGLSDNMMEEYASKLGADCAFFIKNRPTFAKGIGNIFKPINLSLKGYYLTLVKPDIFISTKEAFANIVTKTPSHSLDTLINEPIEKWKMNIVNDFEDSIFKNHKELEIIKNKLYDLGAVYSSMSGSGSTIYGIFKTLPNNWEKQFENCYTKELMLKI